MFYFQAHVRGFLVRRFLHHQIREEFDEQFGVLETNKSEKAISKLLQAKDAFCIIRKFLFIFDPQKDRLRFEHLCRYLISTMLDDDKPNMNHCYVSLALDKQLAVLWIQQLKQLLWRCCVYLKHLKPEAAYDFKLLTLYLNMLVLFTSPKSWPILKRSPNADQLRPAMVHLCSNVMTFLVTKGLYANIQCLLIKGLLRPKACFKKASLSAVITISLRPCISAQFNESIMNLFLLHILSIPALVYHLSTISPESLNVLSSHNLLKRSIELLVLEQNARIVFNALEGNYALCLLANIVHLAHIENETLKDNLIDFVVSCTTNF